MGINSNFVWADTSVYAAFAKAYQNNNGESSSLRVCEDSTQSPPVTALNTTEATTETIAQDSISNQKSNEEEKPSRIEQPAKVLNTLAAPAKVLEKMVIDLATSHRAIQRQVQVASICLFIGTIAMTTFGLMGNIPLCVCSASITAALLSILLAKLTHSASTYLL